MELVIIIITAVLAIGALAGGWTSEDRMNGRW